MTMNVYAYNNVSAAVSNWDNCAVLANNKTIICSSGLRYRFD